MLKKMIILILVFSIGVLPISCRSAREEGSETVLGEFIELWALEDYEQMYALLDSVARESWDMEAFEARYTNISSGIGLQNITLVNHIVKDNLISYTLLFETSLVGDFEQNYTIEATREDKDWRLKWNHGHIFPGLKPELVVRVSRQQPQRGRILDSHGQPLASMGTVYSIGLVPGSMNDDTVAALAQVVEVSQEEIHRLLGQGWVRPDTFVPVKMISKQTWNQERETLSSLKGVTAREVTSRVYDIPASLAQTVGYVAEVSAERLVNLTDKGFRAGDTMGSAGLELQYDEELAGRPGFIISIRDNANNIVSVVAQREVINGSDVRTTLDLNMTRLLDRALGERKGSILVMDYTSGDIVSVISKPGFDSNLFALGITPAQYRELQELDSPLVNRAFDGLYPPGSVFKPFTSLMALEEDLFDPELSWDTPRQWQKSPDWGAYHVTRVVRPLGPVNLRQAMKWSDNVYFADLGLKVGWEAFEEYGAALGFGASIPFAFNQNQSHIRLGSSGEILLADSSYGQGEMLATPLHMTLMYAALARQDGIMPIPRLISAEPQGLWLDTGLSSKHLGLIDGVLAYAASDLDQSGVASETVRGKTGTSEITHSRQIAWYICYFDQLVMTVVLEGDRSLSSTHAVAVARECLGGGIRDR